MKKNLQVIVLLCVGLLLLSNSAKAFYYPYKGAVLKGCSGYKIKFYGYEGYNYLHYSLDSGRTWNFIDSIRTPGVRNHGSYFWVAPAVNTDKALLKITSDLNSSRISASFSIRYSGSSAINLNIFNSEDVYLAGDTREIKWQSQGAGPYVSLHYSTNRGHKWYTITPKTENDGAFDWEIPAILSSDYVVKVQSLSEACVVGQNSAPFTVRANPSITLSAPQKGQTAYSYSHFTVNWSSLSLSRDSVNIEFSSDSGNSWSVIAENEVDDGSFSWFVPHISSSDCFIKVKDTQIDEVFAISEKFSVERTSIDINFPENGAVIRACESNRIVWTSKGETGRRVNIYFSADSGSTWVPLATSIANNAGRNYYDVNFPTVVSRKSLVKIVNPDDKVVSGQSDSCFFLTYNNSTGLSVTSPNGNETLNAGDSENITWTYNESQGSTVKVQFSNDKGHSWQDLSGDVPNTGSYQYTVPSQGGPNCLVRVIDQSQKCISDVSDETFTVVSTPYIFVYNPDRPSYIGKEQRISWNSRNLQSEFVKIEYSVDSGNTWKVISGKNYNNSGLKWITPNESSTNCFIRISDYANPETSEISGRFTIMEKPEEELSPSLEITFPDNWTHFFAYNNKRETITWTSNDLKSSYVNIEYSLDDGETWNLADARVPNTGEYSWELPQNINTRDGLIRISDFADPQINDISGTNFYLSEPEITITWPNGGEALTGCTIDQSIRFNSVGDGEKEFYVSRNNGVTWQGIPCDEFGHDWDISELNCDECLIRIIDANDPTVEDISDAPFSIGCTEDTTLVVTHPNGGEVYTVGDDVRVRWNTNGDLRYDDVNVLYSTDGGINWDWAVTPEGQTPHGIDDYGYMEWRTFVVAPNVIMVVQEFLGESLDFSDYPFTVLGKPSVDVVSPSYGEEWLSSSVKTIEWTSDHLDTNYVHIEYSTDSGSTWKTIAENEIDDGSYDWVVSEDTSSTCLLRVSDMNNSETFAEQYFKISRPYNILSPEKSDTLNKCSYNTIKFESAKKGHVNILYSPDSGRSWSTIVWEHICETGINFFDFYMYTDFKVSESGLIKIEDADDASLFTLSDSIVAVENPYASITLTHPKPGDTLTGGSTERIEWEKSGDANVVHVKYTRISYGYEFDIGYGIDANYVEWEVPNERYTKVWVKLNDINNSCIATSVPVVIKATPEISVQQPSVDDTLFAGSFYPIEWSNKNRTGSPVKIEYSPDSGSTWEIIDERAENYGDYYWKVNATPSDKALIKVTDLSDESVYGISSHSFVLRNAGLTVLSPAAGETVYGCSDVNISWINNGTTPYVDILYSSDNGSTWETITSNLKVESGSESYTWQLPDGVSSTDCKIKIVSSSNSGLYQESGVFSVVDENESVRLTSFTGGETKGSGSKSLITWESTGNFSEVNLYFSNDLGENWSKIAENKENTGSYDWTIPNIESDNCLIKVEGAGSCASDVSDAFSIQKVPFIRIYWPSSSTLRAGGYTSVSWSEVNASLASVSLDYSLDSGNTWVSIASDTSLSRTSFNWLVPDIETEECLIRVSDANDPSVFGIHETMFKIKKPYAKIEYPAEGDALTVCREVEISWNYYGGSGGFDLFYSNDNGISWQTIETRVYGGIYTWTVPSSVSGNILIKVVNKSNPSLEAISGPFAIKDDTIAYKILSPNGGEIYKTGNEVEVSWSNQGGSSDVILNYSSNGGQNWGTIAKAENSGSYKWIVPDLASDNFLIKVIDFQNTCYTAISDSSFTVEAEPFVTLHYPEDGSNLYAGSECSVKWSNGNVSGDKVKIEYSADDGATWDSVAVLPSWSSSYSWTVPSGIGNYLVKVSDESNPLLNDIHRFSSVPAYLDVTSFTEGEVLSGCSSKEIVWEGAGLSDKVNISYSIDNGQSWIGIYFGYTNSGEFDWSVPTVDSDSCLIKVVDYYNKSLYGISDGPFTINKSDRFFNITYPAGGEVFLPDEEVQIEWSYQSLATRVDLLYSSNGGESWASVGTYRNTGRHLWSVPSTSSSEYIFMVRDEDLSCRSGMSDKFTIKSKATESVWPGDADNDGLVDVYDMLSVGMGYSSSGPARDSVSNLWMGHSQEDWNFVQFNGNDMKFADCNGDGVVNYDDSVAVSLNYTLTHTVAEDEMRVLGVNPDLYFIVKKAPVPGDTLHAEIWVGNNSYPVQNLYGIAFNINFTPNSVELGSGRLSFADSWMGSNGVDGMSLSKFDEQMGQVDGVFVRTGNLPLLGYGKIADLKLVLAQDVIAGKFDIAFSEYHAITNEGAQISLNPEEESFLLIPTAITGENLFSSSLYPNPNNGSFYVNSSHEGKVALSVVDVLGKTVFTKEAELSNASPFRLELNNLPGGTYLLKIQTREGLIVKSFIIR